MKTTIVTTTINIPTLLLQYAENASYYGHSNLDFVVIGDRKSPPGTVEFCRRVAQYYPCSYLDIPAQQKYLDRFPELWTHLRFDSIQRRNVGMLLAYENGADVVITIDDDNFVLGQDFVGLHSVVGRVRELPTYSSTSGFFDVCSFLEVENGVRFYHRGYPQKQRWTETGFVNTYRDRRIVAANAGFWLDNPDIDALTRMERQPVVRGYKAHWPGNIALHPGTWSPFNSQNTALMRAVLPAYFLSPYIGRYDDIWASYVIARIAEHLGDVISFGDPLVRQERNPHDLWRDLDVERNGMILTDDFCEALRAVPLSGESYHECFGEVSQNLESAWKVGPKWDQSQQEWRSKFLDGLRIWHEVYDRLSAGRMVAAAAAPGAS
jgi:Reversibly glycosylated polypeptide